MYELDNRKDQVMTVCKVVLANLAMWVRDRYFPLSYAQATWKRLLPFFQLPGTITLHEHLVQDESAGSHRRTVRAPEHRGRHRHEPTGGGS